MIHLNMSGSCFTGSGGSDPNISECMDSEGLSQISDELHPSPSGSVDETTLSPSMNPTNITQGSPSLHSYIKNQEYPSVSPCTDTNEIASAMGISAQSLHRGTGTPTSLTQQPSIGTHKCPIQHPGIETSKRPGQHPRIGTPKRPSLQPGIRTCKIPTIHSSIGTRRRPSLSPETGLQESPSKGIGT